MSMTIGQSAPTNPPSAEEPVLRMEDIQGNIVAGFNKPFQRLLYFHIVDAAAFRLALAELVPLVARADHVLDSNRTIREERGKKQPAENLLPPTLRKTWVNVAFSYAGLAKLRSDDVHKFADTAFRGGLVERLEKRDPRGTEREWVVRDGDHEAAADVLVIVAADHDGIGVGTGALHMKADEVATLLRRHGGVTALEPDEGAVLVGPTGGREHFGFRDGVSQPGVRGLASSAANDLLTARSNPADPDHGKPGQDMVWPGEFVFGYADQAGSQQRGQADWMKNGAGFPRAPAWAKDGSYLVFYRLKQNVHSFHQHLKANRGTGTAARHGARVVGRWPSGAPFARTPTRDDHALANDDEFDFRQAAVPDNAVPLNAHIRKTNPRSDLPDTTTRLRHRLLRRGIPFGTASASTIDDPGSDDGGNRGLLFLAYMTSIVDQFEFVLTSWVDGADTPVEKAGPDALLGQPSKDWIVPTGGGYYFAPSISTLRDVLSA
jgi:Dyp-type peroxidase family